MEPWGALGRTQVALRPGLEGWKEEGHCWLLGGRDVVRTEEDSTALWKGQRDVQFGQGVSWEKGNYRRGGDNQPLSAARDEWLEWDYLNIFREDSLWGIQLLKTLEKDDHAGYLDSFPSSTFWTHTCIWRSLQCRLCWIRYKSLQEGRVKKKGNNIKNTQGEHMTHGTAWAGTGIEEKAKAMKTGLHPLLSTVAHEKGILCPQTIPQGPRYDMKIFIAPVLSLWDCVFSLQIFNLGFCEPWHMVWRKHYDQRGYCGSIHLVPNDCF